MALKKNQTVTAKAYLPLLAGPKTRRTTNASAKLMTWMRSDALIGTREFLATVRTWDVSSSPDGRTNRCQINATKASITAITVSSERTEPTRNEIGEYLNRTVCSPAGT